MLFEVTTKKTLDQIDADLQAAATRHQFGILSVHDLQATMKKKGVEYANRTLIYEVCNPHQAKKVLEANGAVSTVLPCRISVYQAADGFHVATILPTALMKLFDSPEMEPVALEVEATMKAMIEEAAG